jgi:hypothetical protein
MPAGDADDRERTGEDSPHGPLALDALRYVLPAVVVVTGLVVMALGSATELEGGAGIVSAGFAIYYVNWLFRIGVTGDREREAEDAARDYLDRHGRWPDE